MQEQQRFTNFLISSLVIFWVWHFLISPQLFPPQVKPPANKAAEKNDANVAAKDAAKGDKDKGDKDAKPAADPKIGKLHEYPEVQDVVIGANAAAGYRLQAKFDSHGAVVSEIKLLDPRYHELEKKPKEPLAVIRPDPALLARTLATAVPEVDAQLATFKTSLRDVNWEVVKGSRKEDSVTWRYITPDDSLEIRKKFWVEPAPAGMPRQEYKAYALKFELTLTNLGKKPRKLQYELIGPTGLPIENRYYTQKFRDLAMGFFTPSGSLRPQLITAQTIQDKITKQREEEWKTPLKYAGVDIQYFSALLIPQVDQTKTPYFSSTKAIFVDDIPKDLKADTKYRNLTLKFTSTDIDLAAKGAADGAASVSHEFVLYAGPKRADLLAPLGAEQVIDYGWFSGRFGIPQLLLSLLTIFQTGLSFLPYSYGWSIILLTILVRSCLFPLSRKQAIAAAKMQELQPEIAALKEKYKSAPEKFAKAQMDLLNKHKCNPLGGCLPALVQLPIFLGLYHTFNISVEMRGAPFFWIDNLAAPDSLFKFGFVMPFLGPSFNLLPIITVGLFLMQQRLMMPPATTPEAEMQQKMFFYMTIFMGYMFYSVAAGLCIYFIASSLWGVAERTLLPVKKNPGGSVLAQTTATSSKGGKVAVDLLPKPSGK